MTQGARIQLPVMFEHLRSDAGQLTHRLEIRIKSPGVGMVMFPPQRAEGLSTHNRRPSSSLAFTVLRKAHVKLGGKLPGTETVTTKRRYVRVVRRFGSLS